MLRQIGCSSRASDKIASAASAPEDFEGTVFTESPARTGRYRS